MHFRQFYLGCLAQASYFIGSGGFRSSIATSVLEQHGFRHVSNVVGGMTAWNNAKLAVTA